MALSVVSGGAEKLCGKPWKPWKPPRLTALLVESAARMQGSAGYEPDPTGGSIFFIDLPAARR
ncbi:hypothetical protein FACS189498_0280 [Spirochaetia bacterium]|nr:hypothetical protein FACS189498_0280 [Spirochaetia bacterium]